MRNAKDGKTASCTPAMLVTLCLLTALYLAHACDAAPLYVLVLSPYPSERFPGEVGWPGGPALFPAAQLAADMINNRSDILPNHTIRLINGDSGCAFSTRATETFARVTRHQRRQVVGIVGPACSSSATEIGGVTVERYADLVSIAVANGPLLRTANLDNMFRLFSSAEISTHALFKLMQYTGWKSVATVLDTSHWYFPQIYSSFREIIANNTEYTAQLLFLQNDIVPFNAIQNEFNVVIMFASTTDSKKSLCMAFHFDFLYPDYQWILLENVVDGVLKDVEVTYNGKKYTCTADDMKKAAQQAIIIRLGIVPRDKTVLGHADLSYNEFYNLYESYYQNHLHAENLATPNDALDAEKWAAPYFDCLWALGLALNKSVQKGYPVQHESITRTIHNELLALRFTGLTGSIHFHNGTLEVPSTMDIYQVDSANSKNIGYYYEEQLVIDKENASFVDPIRGEVITVRLGAVAVFFPVGVLILILTGSIHLVYVIFHRYKSIRAQSPHFVHLMFSGCYLYILAALLDTIRAANWTGFSDIHSSEFMISFGTLCNVIFWCVTLSTSLIFGTMCVLSWRIYRIFAHFHHPGIWIADPFLAGIVISLLAINVGVLVAWSVHDPLLPHFVKTSKGLRAGILPFHVHCDCKYFGNWLLVWLLNELLIVLVVLLATLNRHVPRKDHFNNTRSHNVLIYIISFLNGICIPIYFVGSKSEHIDTSYIFFQLFTLGSPLSAFILLFLPPAIPVFRKIKVTLRYISLPNSAIK